MPAWNSKRGEAIRMGGSPRNKSSSASGLIRPALGIFPGNVTPGDSAAATGGRFSAGGQRSSFLAVMAAEAGRWRKMGPDRPIVPRRWPGTVSVSRRRERPLCRSCTAARLASSVAFRQRSPPGSSIHHSRTSDDVRFNLSRHPWVGATKSLVDTATQIGLHAQKELAMSKPLTVSFPLPKNSIRKLVFSDPAHVVYHVYPRLSHYRGKSIPDKNNPRPHDETVLTSSRPPGRSGTP